MRRAWLLAGLLTVLSAPSLAVAAQGQSIAPKIIFGLGGGVDAEYGPFDPNYDLETTLGIGGQYVLELMPHFGVGATVLFLFWNADALEDQNVGRSTLIDLGGQLIGFYDVETDYRPLRLTALFQLGPTISFISGDADNAYGGDVGSSMGWHAALMFGGGMEVSEGIRLTVELGYMWHRSDHDLDLPGGSVDLDLHLGQPTIMLGAAF